MQTRRADVSGGDGTGDGVGLESSDDGKIEVIEHGIIFSHTFRKELTALGHGAVDERVDVVELANEVGHGDEGFTVGVRQNEALSLDLAGSVQIFEKLSSQQSESTNSVVIASTLDMTTDETVVGTRLVQNQQRSTHSRGTIAEALVSLEDVVVAGSIRVVVR